MLSEAGALLMRAPTARLSCDGIENGTVHLAKCRSHLQIRAGLYANRWPRRGHTLLLARVRELLGEGRQTSPPSDAELTGRWDLLGLL